MKTLVMAALFALLISPQLAAQCAECYDPPGDVNEYCDSSPFTGFASCGVDKDNNCWLSGECVGTAGDQCAGRPHCIPQKWTCGFDLPEKARWSVASVSIELPTLEAAVLRRKKS